MKKLDFKSLTVNLIAVILRFHVVLVFVFGLAIMSFLEINNDHFEQEFNVWGFFILGAFAMLAISLILENQTKILIRICAFIVPLTAITVYCFWLFNNKVDWEMIQFIAIIFATILSVYCVLFFRKNSDVTFWIFAEKISREFIITLIYTSFLQGGLSLAIYALDVLFNVNIQHEVYGNLAITCYLIIAPVYFLMNIPLKENLFDEAPAYGKFLKILGLYVFLPVLGIYIVILYFYLLKIIVNWELPNGWVTTLVSVLALGGYVAKFLLFPISDNKIVNFLNKYFSLLLLPLIVLMSVGLARRLSDYGISINRLYVLIFNLWLYGVSIYLSLTGSKHLRWVVITFATVLLLSSVGPWSVFSITKRVIERDLTTLMIDNKLFTNGKLTNNMGNKLNIPDSTCLQISDKISYYFNNYGEENWKKSFNDKRKNVHSWEIKELLGVNNSTSNKSNRYINVGLSENRQYDIQDYSTVLTRLEKSYNNNLLFTNKDFKVDIVKNNIEIIDIQKDKRTVFPLNQIITSVYLNSSDEAINNKVLVQKSENSMILINNISADCQSETDFEIKDLNITVFIK